MGAVTIPQMAEQISVLLTERMRIKGDDLADKLSRCGRRLPRNIHRAAYALAEAAHHSHCPKLFKQIDIKTITTHYTLCHKYLLAVNRGYHLRGKLLGPTAAILLSLLAGLALCLGLLFWRGLL